MSILTMEHVSYRDGEHTVLDDIHAEVREGDLIFLTGPSGSGKTTLLRLAAHMISPTKGCMRYRGEDYRTFEPTELRRHLTLIFQNPVLFGDTVRENLEFPYRVRKETPDPARMAELLREFDLPEDFADAPVTNLSGGETQRIALIRGLLLRPDVLLLDEVTSALDPENRERVENILGRYHREGTTILWVSHDQDQVKRLGGRRWTLEDGRLTREEVIA